MNNQDKENMAEMFTDVRTAVIRQFGTGATRSPAEGKPEYAGYLHPSVIKAYGAYMLKHQTDSAGNQRDCRNHKKGIPAESYMQSMFRHFMEVWELYESAYSSALTDVGRAAMIESLMALKFNVNGLASVVLKEDEE